MGTLYFLPIFCKLGTALRNINPINLKNFKYRVPNRLNKHLLDKVIDSALNKQRNHNNPSVFDTTKH